MPENDIEADNLRLSQLQIDVLIEFLSFETVIGYDTPLYHQTTLNQLSFILKGPERGWTALLQNFCILFLVLHKIYGKRVIHILYAVGAWENGNIRQFFSAKCQLMTNITILDHGIEIRFSEDDRYVINFASIPLLVAFYHLIILSGDENSLIGYKKFHEEIFPLATSVQASNQTRNFEQKFAHEIRKYMPRTNHDAHIYRILYSHFTTQAQKQSGSLNMNYINDANIFLLWKDRLAAQTEGIYSYASLLKHCISFIDSLRERAAHSPQQFPDDEKYIDNISNENSLFQGNLNDPIDYSKILMEAPYNDRKWMRSYDDWSLLKILTRYPMYLHQLPLSFLRAKTANFLIKKDNSQKKTTYSVQYHKYRTIQTEIEQTLRTIFLRFIENKRPEMIIMIQKLDKNIPDFLLQMPKDIKLALSFIILMHEISGHLKKEDIKNAIEHSNMNNDYKKILLDDANFKELIIFFKTLKNNQISRTGFTSKDIRSEQDITLLYEGFEHLFSINDLIERFLKNFTVTDSNPNVIVFNNNTLEARWIADQKAVSKAMSGDIA